MCRRHLWIRPETPSDCKSWPKPKRGKWLSLTLEINLASGYASSGGGSADIDDASNSDSGGGSVGIDGASNSGYIDG